MFQAPSGHLDVVDLDSDNEIPEEEWIAATQRDDEYDDATRALLHAPTLELGETDDGPAPMPNDGPLATGSQAEKPQPEVLSEMERVKLEHLRMAEELAELRRQKALPLTSPVNQKALPVTSPVNQKPMFTPESTPAAPSNSEASPEANSDGELKSGEEEIAEEMDLSHQDRPMKFMAHALLSPSS